MEDCLRYCEAAWQDGGQAVEGLKELIKVPNISPEYDPAFFTNGLIQKAVFTVKNWIESQELRGLHIDALTEAGKEPFLFAEVESSSPSSGTVMFYGHLDKMPPLDQQGWGQGLSPRDPVIRNGRIYGRGVSDDGYPAFCIFTSIKYLQTRNLPHPRIVMALECGEESAGVEVVRYLESLKNRIGPLRVAISLDGGAVDYSSIWCCNALRGLCSGVLSVQHLSVPVHSGSGTGMVPSTFRIARMLLSRIEDEDTGEILLKEANIEIPQSRIEQCKKFARKFGKQSMSAFHLVDGAKLLYDDASDCLIANCWKPGLCVTGADGIPGFIDASNVIREKTVLKLSMRIPPGSDFRKVEEAMKKELERDPPYGAKVSFTLKADGSSWFGKDFSESVSRALTEASQEAFGEEPTFYSVGYSMPICCSLQKMWPECDIIITGAAGTDCNAHGYDESLNLAYVAKFNAALAEFLGKLCS